MPFQTVTHIPQNEVAILQAGVDVSDWIPAKGAEGFNFWAYMTSSGAASVLIAVEYTLLQPGFSRTATKSTDGRDLLDPNSTVRANYRSVTVEAALTTKGSWVHFNTPAELKYPISHFRVRCTEGNVAAVTTLSTMVAINGMR